MPNLRIRVLSTAKISDCITVGEAAAYLALGKDYLRRWDRSGKLKSRRHPINGYRLYQKSDLDELLDQFGLEDTPSRRRGSAKKKPSKRK